jgi:hypothetical protein
MSSVPLNNVKYSSLFQLNPIETVIKINEADQVGEARRLVSSFVITPSLADELRSVVVPMLAPTTATEGKGLFIVGNYGTGKSHLMSFISVIAEHAESINWLRDGDWAEPLKPIAGKFLVKRHELNVPDPAAVTLYDVIAEQLSQLAANAGFHYIFRPSNQVTDIKAELSRFMTAFEAAHPDKWLLLVTDEVLDHLRRLTDAQLVRDLGMLRAIGEFADGSRLKFMAGVQQSLFNNDRFQHVASEIARIKQRFADVVIDSKGVEQLIQTYLFEKTEAQKQQIKAKLLKNSDLYEVVGQDTDRFVNLFPAHPRFIDEFERITVVERREILKVLTAEARALQDAVLTDDVPILITADRYWNHIERDKGLDASVEVRQVKLNLATLHARIEAVLPEEDQGPAVRLVNALGVNRLTTATMKESIGLTPHDLKESLLWFSPSPMREGAFLSLQAKRLLDKVREAANGQFLTKSPTSDHYYIDPTLNRDFEQEVATESRTLEPHVVQRYLNEMVTRALEMTNENPIRENQLYESVINWVDRNVERPGWFFFGFPNLRETGKPPKDYYIFICPSTRVDKLSESIEPERDECYWFLEGFPTARFELDQKEQEGAAMSWLDKLRIYAAARQRASAVRKGLDEHTAYTAIAERYLQDILPEFNRNANDWVSVQFGTEMKALGTWMADVDPNNKNASFRTKFKRLNEWWFAAAFAHKYCDYPTFEMAQTESSRSSNARDAMAMIAGVGFAQKGTDQGKSVLRALGLREGETNSFEKSPWLIEVKNRLGSLGDGQFLNHSDLFEEKEGRIWFKGEHIEAEYLLVVLMAGVAEGDIIVVGKQNNQYDASRLDDLYDVLKSPDELVRVGKPKSRPLEEWKSLFGVLGLNKGELAHESKLDLAVGKFVNTCYARIETIVRTQEALKTPLPFQSEESGVAITEVGASLQAAKDQFESLKTLNTKAKMPNLKLSATDVEQFGEHLERVQSLESLLAFLTEHSGVLGAIGRYEAILAGRAADFFTAFEEMKTALNRVYTNPDQLESSRDELQSAIDLAKSRALAAYQTLHQRHRLDSDGVKRKQKLVNGAELKALNKLALIETLGSSKVEGIIRRLEGLIPFKGVSDDQLLKSPTSLHPTDPFDPSKLESDASAADILAACEDEIDATFSAWQSTLLQEMQSDPSVQASISALAPDERKGIDGFLRERKLPDPIDDGFVTTVNQVLKGLKKKPIKRDGFAKAIFHDGKPLRPDELRQRVEEWIKAQTQNEEAGQVRFVLEE